MLRTFTVNVKITIINTTLTGPHFLFFLELGIKTRFQMNVDFYFEKTNKAFQTSTSKAKQNRELPVGCLVTPGRCVTMVVVQHETVSAAVHHG